MKIDKEMKNIIKCAKAIQTHCDHVHCCECSFSVKKDGTCILNNSVPLFWDLEVDDE